MISSNEEIHKGNFTIAFWNYFLKSNIVSASSKIYTMIDNNEYEKWLELLNANIKTKPRREAYKYYVKKLLLNNVTVIFSLRHLSMLTDIKLLTLSKMIWGTNKFYRTFQIPKRNGDQRTISVPYPMLIHCQRFIYNNILQNIIVSESAHGFNLNKSVVTHVENHKKCKWLLKIDLSDFFSSIKIHKIVQVFKKMGYSRNVSFYLSRLCCLNDCLPQGAPTSPALSNIVFYSTDKRLLQLSNRFGIVYSRYADDLVFSGKYVPSNLIKIIENIINEEGYSVNKDKLKLIGPNGRKIVTGISISKGLLKLPRNNRREIRKNVYHLIKNGFENHTDHIGVNDPLYLERILGKLTFWKQVEPDNEYVLKSIKDINLLRKKLNEIDL